MFGKRYVQKPKAEIYKYVKLMQKYYRQAKSPEIKSAIQGIAIRSGLTVSNKTGVRESTKHLRKNAKGKRLVGENLAKVFKNVEKALKKNFNKNVRKSLKKGDKILSSPNGKEEYKKYEFKKNIKAINRQLSKLPYNANAIENIKARLADIGVGFTKSGRASTITEQIVNKDEFYKYVAEFVKNDLPEMAKEVNAQKKDITNVYNLLKDNMPVETNGLTIEELIDIIDSMDDIWYHIRGENYVKYGRDETIDNLGVETIVNYNLLKNPDFRKEFLKKRSEIAFEKESMKKVGEYNHSDEDGGGGYVSGGEIPL